MTTGQGGAHDVREVEHLAEQMCRDAGGSWGARYTKREHWRNKARRMITTARSHPALETLHRVCGWSL